MILPKQWTNITNDDISSNNYFNKNITLIINDEWLANDSKNNAETKDNDNLNQYYYYLPLIYKISIFYNLALNLILMYLIFLQKKKKSSSTT